MSAIADELDALALLATRVNRLPGPNSHTPGNWYHERDEIARAMARSVGRLRKELGIRGPAVTSFSPPPPRLESQPGFIRDEKGRRVPVVMRSAARRPRGLLATDHFR